MPAATAGGDDAAVRRRVAQNLERWRGRRRLSVERLAARSDIDLDRLVEILGARDEARYGEIAMLSGALGIEPDQLFDGITWRPPSDGGQGFDVAEDRPTCKPEAPPAEPRGAGS